MGRKVTQDEVKEWVSLHKKGYTYGAIGERADRDGKTVGKHVREYLERIGEELPQDSELEALNREKDRQKVLMELERVKEERMKVPQRLDELEATLKALVADQDTILKRFKSLPSWNIGRKWKCTECEASDYVAVRVECTKCGYETSLLLDMSP